MASALSRFMAKVRPVPGGCWEWVGARQRVGYGSFRVGAGTVLAHRWAYEQFVGLIPEDREIDHLCRVRHCVNPAHLEVVTRSENMRRVPPDEVCRTHGHPLTAENTYTSPKSGKRACRLCRARRKAVHR